MSDDKRTRVRKPDGFLFEGDEIAYTDRERRVRKPDGFLFKGDEIGYVDAEDQIRKPDGWIFKGDIVGQVKEGDRAHAEDGFIFPGEEWGYVDDSGNIRQRDGFLFRGRIIGHMRGRDKAAALAYYVLRFKGLEERFTKFDDEVHAASDAGRFLGRIRKWRKDVASFDGLGDFDGLIRRIDELERHVEHVQGKHRASKSDICHEAEGIAHSTKWKDGAARIRELRERWKGIGTAGHDADDELWQRFNAACTTFFDRRAAELARNREAKEKLCSRAEELSRSTRWKETADALKELSARWKEIGSAGRDHDEPLWQRFRAACDRFYEARSAAYEQRDREQRRNLEAKRALISEAYRLAHLVHADADLRTIADAAKDLRRRWKDIGHVPRDEADAVWREFNEACDGVFGALSAERDSRQERFRDRIGSLIAKKRDLLAAQEEQIDTLQQHIARWENTIANLRGGRGADEIRDSMETKIASAEDKIDDKRRFIRELEEQIEELEAKLHR
jgi:polyhydroxyalkanoate synthesis regulator phasin